MADLAARDLPVCPVCRMHHITHRRPEGVGFVCRYRAPDEHYHDSYEEMLACQGRASEKQILRASKAAAARTGMKGRHPRKALHGSGDKPTSPDGVAA